MDIKCLAGRVQENVGSHLERVEIIKSICAESKVQKLPSNCFNNELFPILLSEKNDVSQLLKNL